MAEVKFYLDKENIFLSYYVRKGDVVRLSLKEKVPSKYWDAKKYRVKYSNKNAAHLNQMMDSLEAFVKETRIQYKIQGDVFNGSILKRLILKRLHGETNSLIKSYAASVFLPSKQGNVKDVTFNSYRVSVNKINKYLDNITFEQINRMSSLTLEKGMKKDGYSINYVNKVFRVLKDCIHMAYTDGVHNNKYHLSNGFVPSTESVDNVYLSLEELDLIYLSILNKKVNDKLVNASIIFLIGCYTGQRFQSFQDINKAMVYEVSGVQMLSIRQGKTNNTVAIPVSEKLMTLLYMKYHAISQQKLRDYIKEVCVMVGIEKSKASRVGTHTARRTFATNMVLSGVDITKIMKITGHKTELEFRKYVKIDGVQSAISVIDEMNKIF